jgi:hypothetical protein
LDSLARRAFDEVEEHVNLLLSISEDEMAEGALGMNIQIQGKWVFHVRGVARFEHGDYVGAVEDLRRAEADGPDVLAISRLRREATPRNLRSLRRGQ